MRSLVITLIAVCLALPALADAARGTVVYRIAGCDYYIVETIMGYDVLEWFAGDDPDIGDVLVGDFESYGMKDIYNLTDSEDTRAWVEEYWMTQQDALEELYEQCS